MEDELKKKVKKNYINLISYENFFPYYWFDKSDNEFNNCLEKIYQICNKKNFDTTIILTLREQVSYIESYYLQTLKENKKKTFEQFINNDIDIYNLNYYELTRKLKTKFSDVKYTFYELLFEKNIGDSEKYYIKHFMDLFSNIDVDTLDLVKNNIYKSNISFTKDKMKYFLETNNPKTIKNLRKKFQTVSPQISYYKYLFSNNLKQKLLEYYKDSNEKINLLKNNIMLHYIMSKYYKDIKLDNNYLIRSNYKINKSMTKKNIESILNYIKDEELYFSGICHVHRVINNYLKHYNKMNNEFNDLLLISLWYSQNISLKLREYKSDYDKDWYDNYSKDNNNLDEDGWNINIEIKRKNNYDNLKINSIIKENNSNISYNTEPYNVVIKLLNYNIDSKINKCLKYILWIIYRMELKLIEYEKI